jgi:hypothetical protein
MTITKTMTPPTPAAIANATGVRAETVALSPFHSASHASHLSRGIVRQLTRSAVFRESGRFQ